jgi:predicted Zn-dependent protease
VDAQAAVAASPGNAAARVLLVRSSARSEGTAAGIEAAVQGIAAVGRVRILLLPLARLLNDGGRWEEAIETLEEIAGALDGAQNAQLALARAKAKAGARDAARQLVAALTEGELGPAPAPPRRLRPDAQVDFGRLGAWTREHWPGRLAATREALEVQLREKNWAEAQRIVDSARRAWPETSFGPFLAGALELARGQMDLAERQFSEALVPAPRFPTVIAALARAWGRSRGAAFAGDQLMRLAERDPGLASARYMAARAYVEARDPIKAEAALRRGLRLQPGSPVPYQQLTDYYFGLDRTREALDICREGLQRFPQAVDLQLMLAQISASVGGTADAVHLYDDLLSRRPDLDLALYKLAVLLASQEAPALRQRFSRVARELQNDRPSDPLLADALGWVLFKAGNVPRARELLEDAVKEAPDEPGPHFHLAALYAREHEQDLVRGELKLALDSPRPFPERLDALRLLRETPPVNGAKDGAGVSPARH